MRAAEPRKVGIREVAKAAGVSVASVSRTLSKPEMVSEEMRRRIEDAIDRLNYVPNSAARSLSLRRTHAIGAIVPTLDYSIFGRFIEGIQHRANLSGYSLLLSTSGFDRDRELEQARDLLSHGVEGLILSGECHRAELHRVLQSRDIPYAHTSIYSPGSAHPCVGYDNEAAAKQTAEHLLSLGHRAIGALVGPRESNDRMVFRIAGIRAALEARKLALPESRIVERPFSISRARDGFRELLARDPSLTAVLCGNDVLAFGVVLEAQAMGLEVPRDLSVIGFDNLDWAAEIRPRLTTVKVPAYDMGEAAADYLIGRLTGATVSPHTKLELDLILRESTGPAPQRVAASSS